jgi:uncharacterized membrane protein
METEKNIYEYFRIGILLKGAVSILEIIAGALMLFARPALVNQLAMFFTRGELMEEPNDFVANQILHLAHSFSTSLEIFLAFYLLSRGVIKLFLIVALLRNKLWAYPASLIVLGLFVLYQIYQIVTLHSILIVAITAFDLVVLYFIYREYLVVRKRVSA